MISGIGSLDATYVVSNIERPRVADKAEEAYAIGICVVTFDSRVRVQTMALSRFGEPSTARSHSRKTPSSRLLGSRGRAGRTRPFS